MLNPIYGAIGKFLGWIDSFTGSYVLALFIFAILVELLMLPFGIKQQSNSIKQAKLRPKEMAIRKKYKGRNDQPTQQKISQEIQELYSKEGFNPMAGCLPLIIQIPIIMILYQIVVDPLRHVVGLSADAISGITQYVTAAVDAGGLGLTFNSSRGTIELINVITEQGIDAFRGLADFAGFTDVTATGAEIFAALQTAYEAGLPNFNLFGLNLALTPSFTSHQALLVIPAITFVVYFLSNKLIRKLSFQPQMAANDQQQGCSNAMMDFMMPLMSVYFTFLLPGAIGVYWIFKSVLSTLKQFLLSRVMPLPKFTEEDIKEAEREMKAQSKGQTTKRSGSSASNGQKPRSLHHIDDDDYEQPAEAPKPKKADSGMASLVDTPTLKEDKKDTEDDTPSDENDENSDENKTEDEN